MVLFSPRRSFENDDPRFLALLARGVERCVPGVRARPLAGGALPSSEERAFLGDAERERIDVLLALALGLDVERRRHTALARSLALHQTRKRVEAALDAAALPYVFLKGVLSDALFFGGSGARGGTDVDLLVRRAHLREVTRALEGAGFSPVVRRDRQVSAAAVHERRFVPEPRRSPCSSSAIEIDLHWGVAWEPPYRDPAGDIVARAQVYETRLGRVRGPTSDDILLHAAMNLATAKFYSGRLRLVVDAACVLATMQPELALVRERAERAGASWALWALLSLVDEHFDAGLERAFLDELAPPPLRRLVASSLAGVGRRSLVPHRRALRLVLEGAVLGRPLWPVYGAVRFLSWRALDVVVARLGGGSMRGRER